MENNAAKENPALFLKKAKAKVVPSIGFPRLDNPFISFAAVIYLTELPCVLTAERSPKFLRHPQVLPDVAINKSFHMCPVPTSLGFLIEMRRQFLARVASKQSV